MGRVEKETLRKVVEEKDQEMYNAYLAIERYHEEKVVFEKEIEFLKSQLTTQTFAASQQSQIRQVEFEDVGRPSLLEEAFGSMNLGPHSGDDKYDAEIKELKERNHQLELDLNIEKDHANDLKKIVDEKDDQIDQMTQALIDKE